MAFFFFAMTIFNDAKRLTVRFGERMALNQFVVCSHKKRQKEEFVCHCFR